ncbi:hypothetical protein BKA93DRAFT_829577 [Sparassis latifolia]
MPVAIEKADPCWSSRALPRRPVAPTARGDSPPVKSRSAFVLGGRTPALSPALITTVVSVSARRASRIFVHILLLLSVWLFAALVPFTDFVANRQANVSATLDGVALPPSVIQAVQAQSGVTGIYHEILYLRLATVFPRWIAFLFGGLSAVLSYTTERGPDSARYPLVAGGRAGSIRDVDDKPKEAEQVGIRQV